MLIRPFVLRVNKSTAAGQNSWLTIDASSNIHAVGVVQRYDFKNHCIFTDAPFPNTRPYTYNFDENTGFSGQGTVQRDYNGGYNGFWLVGNHNPHQRAIIKNLENKRTQIMLGDNTKSTLRPGDKFEIQLLAPGDLLEVPAWGQINLDENGTWKVNGPAIVNIIE
jgi:hypothetical protein